MEIWKDIVGFDGYQISSEGRVRTLNKNAEFHFDLDVCATPENAKCERFFTKAEDGLKQSWGGGTVYCNPPYGREIAKWVKKASEEDALTVMLIPARTDTRWFHDYIYGKHEVRFIRGRLKFGGSMNAAPFPSMIVVFRNGEKV